MNNRFTTFCLLIGLTSINNVQLHAQETITGNNQQSVELLQGNKMINDHAKLSEQPLFAETFTPQKLTRDEHQLNKKNQFKAQQVKQKSAVSKLSTPQTVTNSNLANMLETNNAYYAFDIYEANITLIRDNDLDGYYSRFSLSFDADLLSDYADESALVYAEIYISENGGPWLHFSTTDDFVIYEESSEDEYEIISTLQRNYASEHYDFLIDLYEVGYEDVVATYSADNDTALYAVPLESRDYDPIYDDVQLHTEVHHHGGSLNWLSLFAFLPLIFKRKSAIIKPTNH